MFERNETSIPGRWKYSRMKENAWSLGHPVYKRNRLPKRSSYWFAVGRGGWTQSQESENAECIMTSNLKACYQTCFARESMPRTSKTSGMTSFVRNARTSPMLKKKRVTIMLERAEVVIISKKSLVEREVVIDRFANFLTWTFLVTRCTNWPTNEYLFLSIRVTVPCKNFPRTAVDRITSFYYIPGSPAVY